MITNKDAKEFHKMIKKLEEENKFEKDLVSLIIDRKRKENNDKKK